MAKWDDVKGLLKNNYTYQEFDDGAGIVLLKKYDDGRQQKIVVFPKVIRDNDWIEIVSVVGTIKPEDLNAALDFTKECAAGGLIRFDETHAVRHCIPIADLSANEILGPLTVIAAVADLLEERFIGVDKA